LSVELFATPLKVVVCEIEIKLMKDKINVIKFALFISCWVLKN
jgi:hypothetical protein